MYLKIMDVLLFLSINCLIPYKSAYFLFQFIYTYTVWDNVASEKRQLQKLLKMKMFSGLEQRSSRYHNMASPILHLQINYLNKLFTVASRLMTNQYKRKKLVNLELPS